MVKMMMLGKVSSGLLKLVLIRVGMKDSRLSETLFHGSLRHSQVLPCEVTAGNGAHIPSNVSASLETSS